MRFLHFLEIPGSRNAIFEDKIYASHLILPEVFYMTLKYGLAAQVHCHVLYGASKYRMEVATALCCQFQALNRVKWSEVTSMSPLTSGVNCMPRQ
jgi:hypothetical protein